MTDNPIITLTCECGLKYIGRVDALNSARCSCGCVFAFVLQVLANLGDEPDDDSDIEPEGGGSIRA